MPEPTHTDNQLSLGPMPLPGRLAVLAAIGLLFALGRTPAAPFRTTTLHYAPNGNFAEDGTFLPAKAGFNLADVSKVHEIHRLEPGYGALVWVGQCNGVNEAFLQVVRAYAGRRNLFGFMLMDDPDPRLRAKISNPSHACAVDNLKAEADWIHEHVPGARTVIVLMNMGYASQPSFRGTYEPASSHVDLFGLAAAAEAGVSPDRIVPIYQAFGGGDWKTDTGGHYVLPDAGQVTAILSRWRQLIPRPEMDMAYSWGSQRGDRALESSLELQAIFAKYNSSRAENEGAP
jgi:hypothetical protein